MASRLIVFEPEDLYQLLVHYNQGETLPMDGKVLNFGFSQFLSRWLGMEVESDRWPTEGVAPGPDAMPMVHVRYEGKKTMSWSDKGVDPRWREAVEAPKRQ
jgi:hypothetical protein